MDALSFVGGEVCTEERDWRRRIFDCCLYTGRIFDVYRVAPQTWRQGLAGIPGRGNSTEKGGAVFAQIRWI